MKNIQLCAAVRNPLTAVVVMVVMTAALVSSAAAAVTYKVLHIFTLSRSPEGSVVRDAAGNLYGTTMEGGHLSCNNGYGCGVVFKLTPHPDGSWVVNTIHFFNGADGNMPVAGLILDAAGNLYGTTKSGGAYGWGVVFQLTPNSNGSWTEHVLHSFKMDQTDGLQPQSRLTFDAAGNLYGTTTSGGPYGDGVVFKLVPNSDGTWTESVLQAFSYGSPNGDVPYGPVIFDASGNLYGTTIAGGAYAGGGGVVYKLTPNVDGTWTESVLYKFLRKPDGDGSFAGLTFDAAGNLYGTTVLGGVYDRGTVFRLKPNPDGTWTESVLHSFTGGGDGNSPNEVMLDKAGNLYGTTYKGGAYNFGTVFKLKQNTNETWTETVLHTFEGKGTYSGKNPSSGVIMDATGNVYGTTSLGSNFYGLVFQITP